MLQCDMCGRDAGSVGLNATDRSLKEGIESRNLEQVQQALANGADPSVAWSLTPSRNFSNGERTEPIEKVAFVHALTCPGNPDEEIIDAIWKAGIAAPHPYSLDFVPAAGGGWSALHWVALSSDSEHGTRLWEILSNKKILKDKSMPRAFATADRFGMLPLHVACNNAADEGDHSTKLIKSFINNCEPTRHVDGAMFKRFDGWTALCFAAAAGSHTAVDAILSDKRVVTASFLHANASNHSTAAVGIPAGAATAFTLAARNLLADHEALKQEFMLLEKDVKTKSTQGVTLSIHNIRPDNAEKILMSLINAAKTANAMDQLGSQVAYLQQQIQAVQSMEKEKMEAKADAVQKANAVVTAYQNMGGQIGACEGGSITVANGSKDFKQGDTKEGDCSCVMM